MFYSSHCLVSGPLLYSLLEVLLISLTGIWPFTMLTVGVLLKSLTGVWSFIMLVFGVLH